MPSNTGHERLQDGFIHFPESRYLPSRLRSVHLIYTLLAVSYLLIVVLFVTEAMKAPNSVKSNETASALAALKSNVQAISNKTDALKSEYKTDIANVNSRVQNGTRDRNAQESDIKILQNSIAILKSKTIDLANSMKNGTPANACGEGSDAWQYYGGSCYLFVRVKSNWMDGKAMCESKNAILAIITSEGEQNFLKSKSRNEWYWIGLNDRGEQHKWEWIDGTDYKTNIKFWTPGEPNNNKELEDCAHLWKEGLWNDWECKLWAFSLCEKKATV